VYLVSKVQESLEGEEMDEETKRKKMTERVVSFLLVDENEEIQVSRQPLRTPVCISACCWELALQNRKEAVPLRGRKDRGLRSLKLSGVKFT
jgi:hypothetical protein